MIKDQSMGRRLGAEFLGTYLLVLGGCGAAVLAAKSLVSTTGEAGEATGSYNLGIGFVGVSMAFGLTLVAGIYAFGLISGGHFNPAVTVGLATAKRFAWKDALLVHRDPGGGGHRCSGNAVGDRSQSTRRNPGAPGRRTVSRRTGSGRTPQACTPCSPR